MSELSVGSWRRSGRVPRSRTGDRKGPKAPKRAQLVTRWHSKVVSSVDGWRASYFQCHLMHCRRCADNRMRLINACSHVVLIKPPLQTYSDSIVVVIVGSVTITIEVGTNGPKSLSRMQFSAQAGHVTIFSSMFTIACCVVVGLGFGLDLVSGWLVVTHTRICTTFDCHCLSHCLDSSS